MNYPKAVLKDVPIKPAVEGKRFSNLRVVAYYPTYWEIKNDPTDEAFFSGDVLRALIPLLGDVTFAEVDSGIIEDGRGYFDPLSDTSFDIGYEVCARPKRKIAKWVFGFVSDFIGREPAMKAWFRDGHLDALFTLRNCSQRLGETANKYGLPIYHFPYFVVNKQEWLEDKTIDGALIGTRGEGYSWRQRMYEPLRAMSNKYSILIHDANSKAGRIPYVKYIQTLRKVKYFFCGGVNDEDGDAAQIPAKQFEAAASGACIVSHDLPMMKACGFIDDKTYIQLNDVSEIPDILASDRWKTIGKAGWELVNKYHDVETRAKKILEVARS